MKLPKIPWWEIPFALFFLTGGTIFIFFSQYIDGFIFLAYAFSWIMMHISSKIQNRTKKEIEYMMKNPEEFIDI